MAQRVRAQRTSSCQRSAMRRRSLLRHIAVSLQGSVDLWRLLRQMPEEEALTYGSWRHEMFKMGKPTSVELFVQHINVRRRLLNASTPQRPTVPENRTIRR